VSSDRRVRPIVVPEATVTDLRAVVGPRWVEHGSFLVRLDGDRLRVRLRSMSAGQVTWTGTASDGVDGLLLTGRVRDPAARVLASCFWLAAAMCAGLLGVLLVEDRSPGPVAATAVLAVLLGAFAGWFGRRVPDGLARHHDDTERVVGELLGRPSER
jgi:hypothetical protein